MDGLSSEELRASRLGWWDRPFTRLLLDWIVPETRSILDIGCGLATAAHALLPFLPNMHYVGIDADEQRLKSAENQLAGAPYEARVKLKLARIEQLPFPDSAFDCALSVMTLQHLADTHAALCEVKRAVCTGGRLLAVEPDNLVNLFYFDGPLDGVNEAFRELFAAVRHASLPADISIGPAVPRYFEAVGLKVLDCKPYTLGRVKRMMGGEFLAIARRVAEIVAVRLSATNLAAEPCFDAIDRAAAVVGSDVLGYACHFVPAFVTVGEKTG